MEKFISTVNSLLWGIPVLTLILILGIRLTISSGFAQIRLFPDVLKRFFKSVKNNRNHGAGISGYRALCTALAATVGTGNIAGVAGAIAIGGPGTIFWMWMCAILGMIIKMAEVTLAQRYRVRNEMGEFVGGPMYIIQSALPKKYMLLAYIYAFFCVVAAFGVGNATQVNTVVESIKSMAACGGFILKWHWLLIIGVIIVLLIIRAFRYGATGVGSWAEKLVPFASVIYIGMCFAALFACREHLFQAVYDIFSSAFSPKSITGGVICSAIITLRVGASRGVFTNEAGMGTAAIVHASAEVDHPVEQGLLGIMEVFLDTILICTLTALVILSSGVHIPYGTDPGIVLTLDAFSETLGEWSRYCISGLVCIFAFATILGWGVYGMRCAQYLFGESVWRVYIAFQAGAAILGILLRTSVVWILSEIVNGLMAIPNLIMLFILSPELFRLLDQYQKRKRTV